MIIKTDPELISQYLRDASNFEGRAEILYIPENYEELRTAVRECFKLRMSITMTGGRTGLTGGCAASGGAVISTERMNTILALDPERRTARLEPGVLLKEFQNYLDERDCFYPPDPTEWSSSLGGNVSTNASGARTFKYGATRNYVQSLRLILADGEELHLRRGEVFANGNVLEISSLSGKRYTLDLPEISMPDLKHAAGYYIHSGMDAIDLFIGSEGTLAVVGEIELKFAERPERILGGVVFFDDENKAFDFVERVRESSRKKWREGTPGRIESRLLEFFDKNSLALLRKTFTQLPSTAQAAIWFEQEYSAAEDENRLLDQWSELIQSLTGLYDDTWLALSPKEHQQIREFRHALPSAVYETTSLRKQRKVGTDIAVPDIAFREMYAFYMDEFARAGIDYVIFGHIGNNHLHANLFPENQEKFDESMAIYERCIDKALRLGGTVSAEHGIGKLKRKYLLKMFGPEAIAAMRNIKRRLDPEMLLGRESVFESESL